MVMVEKDLAVTAATRAIMELALKHKNAFSSNRKFSPPFTLVLVSPTAQASSFQFIFQVFFASPKRNSLAQVHLGMR